VIDQDLLRRIRELPINVRRVLMVESRLCRLRALEAPDNIVENERQLLRKRIEACTPVERTMLLDKKLVDDWDLLMSQLDGAGAESERKALN
jgi:hypothetical protein